MTPAVRQPHALLPALSFLLVARFDERRCSVLEGSIRSPLKSAPVGDGDLVAHLHESLR
jgi:hypothetical protein